VESVDSRKRLVANDIGRTSISAQRVAIDDRHGNLGDDPEMRARSRTRAKVLRELEAKVSDALMSI
jgi:hypothetical protein